MDETEFNSYLNGNTIDSVSLMNDMKDLSKIDDEDLVFFEKRFEKDSEAEMDIRYFIYDNLYMNYNMILVEFDVSDSINTESVDLESGKNKWKENYNYDSSRTAQKIKDYEAVKKIKSYNKNDFKISKFCFPERGPQWFDYHDEKDFRNTKASAMRYVDKLLNGSKIKPNDKDETFVTVYRYMSREEFGKLISGETIIGKDGFNEMNSTSRGICFLDDEVYPLERLSFLSGIVSEDFLVEFKVDQNKLIRSAGSYADPYIFSDPNKFWTTIYMKEYCTPEYNKNDFQITAFCVPNKETEFGIPWFLYNGEKALSEIDNAVENLRDSFYYDTDVIDFDDDLDSVIYDSNIEYDEYNI